MTYDLIKLDKPIRQTRTCTNCGRKRTFVFVYQLVKSDSNEKLGLRTKDGDLCSPYMFCPRCNNFSMIEED